MRTPAAPENAGAAFVAEARRVLLKSLMPRIRKSVERLSVADFWWRPNAASNSIANLMLHLAGNVRQWIVHGVGGAPDVRDRAAEFSARRTVGKRELLRILARALRDADRVLSSLDPRRLLERRRIQGYDLSVQDAILHVVEHFSYHTGQILYVTKMRTGAALGFYAHFDVTEKPEPASVFSVRRQRGRGR